MLAKIEIADDGPQLALEAPVVVARDLLDELALARR